MSESSKVVGIVTVQCPHCQGPIELVLAKPPTASAGAHGGYIDIEEIKGVERKVQETIEGTIKGNTDLTLSRPPTTALAIKPPKFVFMGRKPVFKNESEAPDTVTVTEEGYTWLCDEMGWRGSHRWAQHHADACLDWAKGKRARKANWEATVRNWLRGQVTDGKDIEPSNGGYANGRNGGRDNGEGRDGPYPPNPSRASNRADKTISAAYSLGERQRARLDAEQAREDAVHISQRDGGGS